jgi:hypothetical protein
MVRSSSRRGRGGWRDLREPCGRGDPDSMEGSLPMCFSECSWSQDQSSWNQIVPVKAMSNRSVDSSDIVFFLNYTYNTDTHNANILTSMNTRTQTLPLWAPPKDWAGRSRDSRSHRRRPSMGRRLPLKAYTNPTPYEHFRRTEPVDHEIHEVPHRCPTIDGTSPTTESISPLNSGINKFRKIQALVPSRELESGWAGFTTRNPTSW